MVAHQFELELIAFQVLRPHGKLLDVGSPKTATLVHDRLGVAQSTFVLARKVLLDDDPDVFRPRHDVVLLEPQVLLVLPIVQGLILHLLGRRAHELTRVGEAQVRDILGLALEQGQDRLVRRLMLAGGVIPMVVLVLHLFLEHGVHYAFRDLVWLHFEQVGVLL